MDKRITSAVEVAISEAKQAYDFAPGSYTYSALSAAYRVRQEMMRPSPDWIEEIISYGHGFMQ